MPRITKSEPGHSGNTKEYWNIHFKNSKEALWAKEPPMKFFGLNFQQVNTAIYASLSLRVKLPASERTASGPCSATWSSKQAAVSMCDKQYCWAFTTTNLILPHNFLPFVLLFSTKLLIYPFLYLVIYWGVVSEKSALFGQDNCGWETSWS